MFAVLASEQWAELVRALLDHVAVRGRRELARVGAGAETGKASTARGRGEHADIEKDLLWGRASIAAKNKHGRAPLHTAAYCGKTEMCSCCCSNERWISMMHIAAYGRNVGVLRAMIEHGADLEAVDGFLRTHVIMLRRGTAMSRSSMCYSGLGLTSTHGIRTSCGFESRRPVLFSSNGLPLSVARELQLKLHRKKGSNAVLCVPWTRAVLSGESLSSYSGVGQSGQLHVPVDGSHSNRSAGGHASGNRSFAVCCPFLSIA